MNDKELVIIQETDAAIMPAMTIEAGVERYNLLKQFVSEIMIEGTDYGVIPGTKKDTLLKPGAEKLTTHFGLSVKFRSEKNIENWDMEAPLFFYHETCILTRGNLLIAEAGGSANSRESRYQWRWVQKEDIALGIEIEALKTRGGSMGHFQWQIDKGETTGQYGKPQEYWDAFREAMEAGAANIYDKEQHWKDGQLAPFVEIEQLEYRVPNEDIFSLVNTILKMAQKRALVAATLIGCNASDFFTQDIEDGGIVEGEIEEVAPMPVQKADRPLSPVSLRSFLAKRALSHKDKSASDEQRKFLAGLLGQCMDNDKNARYAVTKYLTGASSTSLIDHAMVYALMDWLNPEENDNHPDSIARDECQLVFKVAMVEQGQQELGV